MTNDFVVLIEYSDKSTQVIHVDPIGAILRNISLKCDSYEVFSIPFIIGEPHKDTICQRNGTIVLDLEW